MQLDELEEILLSFAYKDEDINKAHNAFEQLYKEYSKFLFAVVRNNIAKMSVNDEEMIETIVNNVFLTLYEKPPMNFEVKDGKSVDGSFKAYLSVMAKHESLNQFERYFKTHLVLTSDVTEEIAFQDTEVDLNIAVSVNLKNMMDALNTLTERDREILRMLYLYQEEGKKTPSQVLDTICEIFDTTRDNIRQIKKRSEAKIIEYFARCTQLKPVKNVR